jgi:histidine ammonia-lyase
MHAADFSQPPVILNANPITLAEVERVVRLRAPVALGDGATRAIDASRERLEQAMRAKTPIYGVNTGFGSLARRRIDDAKLAEVQRNLLRSHAAGSGAPLPAEQVRAMLLLLAGSLARGRSGVRRELVDALVAMLNAGVVPVVPTVGSVGASGDLAPLAHAALPLIGEGLAYYDNETLDGAAALARASLTPITLAAKEGLALINGTHLMAGLGCLALLDSARLLDAALVACAMSIDACRATHSFLDPRAHEARNQPAQMVVAERLRTLLEGSQVAPAHKDNDSRVQDPYSLRCAPQILGAALETLDNARQTIERELGAVTDNPLVVEPDAQRDSVIVSAGNFHGMPLALALDSVCVACMHIAGVAERRVFFLLGATDPENPVPAHLSPQPGLHSGLMITQYTAAACVNELAHLASPASVINIPTCAGMEDYNSFGPLSARKALRSVELSRTVVAIELLCAAQGMEFQRPLRSGAGVERAYALVRERVAPLEADRPPAPDIAALEGLIAGGALSPGRPGGLARE